MSGSWDFARTLPLPSSYLMNPFKSSVAFHIVTSRSLGESGLVGWGVTIRIGTCSNPLGAQPGLRTQPRYKDPGGHRAGTAKSQWLTSCGSGCPIDNSPKLPVMQPNSSLKILICTANQMTGFYIKWDTGLKWVKVCRKVSCAKY